MPNRDVYVTVMATVSSESDKEVARRIQTALDRAYPTPNGLSVVYVTDAS